MKSEPDSPEPEPSFLQLLGANAKIVGALFLFALACFGLWRALRALFPDIAWLQ